MNLLSVIAVVSLLVIFTILKRKRSSTALRVDYNSFLNYINFMTKRGKVVTQDHVETIEGFTTAMNGQFTAREEASYLAKTTPERVKGLRAKAERAKTLWNKLSSVSKYLAYITAAIVFVILYSNWAGPLWDMMVTFVQFVWGVLKSLPLSILAAVPFVIFLYVAKKFADYKKELYRKRAAAVEATIPEITKVNAILNQK